MKSLVRFSASSTVAMLILLAWSLSAAYFDQSLFAMQRSLWLPQLGAATGELFENHEWWRLLVSQLLHVHFLHMLFNAACVFLAGGLIEQVRGWRMFLLIYFVGGTIGQAASVLAYPTLVTDGASQALMALCGPGLLLLSRPSPRFFVALITAVQIGLDLHAIARIKAGHLFGFGAGLLIAGCILIVSRSRVRTESPNHS